MVTYLANDGGHTHYMLKTKEYNNNNVHEINLDHEALAWQNLSEEQHSREYDGGAERKKASPDVNIVVDESDEQPGG